jgi:N-acetylmuramoyl-L-alanine amidase
LTVAAVAALLAILTGTPAAQAPSSAAPYTVLSRDGRRPLAARTVGGQEMFALDDLARLFDLTVREDTLAGGLTVTVRNQTIVLTPGQSLASVGGRLISLPAPATREGRTWFVPVDFVSRALAPVLGTNLELRKPSRLILVGDVRVPRVAGRVESLGNNGRLTLDVAPATPHTVSQDGQRLFIRFEADALDASLPTSTAPDLIQSVRPGDGPAVVTVELGPRFAAFKSTDVPADRGAGRIVIDVVGQTTEPAPGQPAAPAAAAPEAPPLLDLAPAGGLRTVVIDPGHGGADGGSKGASGGLEKNVTLSVARRLKSALESRLGLRVILTRDSDETVALDQRAALANNNKADLFLSLHANASVRPSATGAEVFYLGVDDYADAAQRVSLGERAALPVFGGGTRDIEVIPWEMAQVRYIEESAALAQAIEAALRERVPVSPRAMQQAPFRVLVGANMPAVLLEMGFMTNPAQEKQLMSDAFQADVVEALVASIVRFRDARSIAGGGR